MKINKVLITTPNLNKPGGVTSLFNILKMEQYYPNVSLFILDNKLYSIFRIPYKYLEFIYKLRDINLVHLNPSLNRKSFLRDAVFAWLTLLFSRKLIIYWHGWEEEFENKIKTSRFLRFVNRHSFLKAQASIVLGTIFESKLKDLGYHNRVYVETNTAENKYLSEQKAKNLNTNEKIKLLFLSRLEVTKGIYIAIDTLNILNKNENRFKLIIAGTGSQANTIKQLAAINNNIEWVGYVTNQSKHNLLSSSQFMFFPTYYPEGMPLTILEGIIYGLPIISCPVGGIPDVIKDDINGYLIESLYPEDFAEKINKIIKTPDLYYQMSQNNVDKSNLFSPQVVRERIYGIYEIINHDK